MGHRHDASNGERGFVLVYCAVMGLLTMLVWAVAYRATHEAIRVEKTHVRREIREHSVGPALAEALDLLETGVPPADPYQCLIQIVDGSTTYDCTLTYQSVLYPDSWNVTATESTAAELATLPYAPASF